MEHGDSLFGLLSRGHFHKAETAGATRHAILDDVDGDHCSSGGKMVLEIIFRGSVVDITDE
jgi:hypothetical protein